MGKHTIPKGKHRAKGLHIGLYHAKEYFEWEVMFTPSCRYDVGKDYQKDIQKLVGLRYFSGDNSARFGWRFVYGEIQLLAYVHDNGVVTKSETEVLIGAVKINDKFRIAIEIEDNAYIFTILKNPLYKPKVVPKTHKHKWAFRQGFYFEAGEKGEVAAPHNIVAHIKKIK